MSFGRALARIMKERGLSQRELARLAGVHYSLVSRVLRGERQPTLPFIEAIAPHVYMKPSELLAMASDGRPTSGTRPSELSWLMSDMREFLPDEEELARYEARAVRPGMRKEILQQLARRADDLKPFPWLGERVASLQRKLAERFAPAGQKALAAGALLYFVTVLDCIPDFTGFGLVDDAAVLYAAWHRLSRLQ